jgi:hypothetical protein
MCFLHDFFLLKVHKLDPFIYLIIITCGNCVSSFVQFRLKFWQANGNIPDIVVRMQIVIHQTLDTEALAFASKAEEIHFLFNVAGAKPLWLFNRIILNKWNHDVPEHCLHTHNSSLIKLSLLGAN